MRIGLAFRAFFAVLGGRELPEELVAAPKELSPGPDTEPPVTPKESPPPVETPSVAGPAGPPPGAEAVQTLGILQSSGRLLDFLSEDITDYSDEDVGAAVRDIHRDLRKALADHFPVEPVRGEDEDAQVTVPDGFDPVEIRLVGNVVGEPPFTGILKHKGWRVTSVRLPTATTSNVTVVAPAEVEL